MSKKAQAKDKVVKQKRIHMRPAEYVIHIFGGVSETARAVDRTRSCICKWKNPRWKSYGAEGKVPSAVQKKLLKVAKERGLDITAEDLIMGREVRV